jgi:hypothetical protein
MIGREECAARSAESAAIWWEPPMGDIRGVCISFGIAGVDISYSQPFHGMTCRQAYATPQSVCHLPIEQLLKKSKRKKSGCPICFFRWLVGSEIKHSLNCLRILILSNYQKMHVSRIG